MKTNFIKIFLIFSFFLFIELLSLNIFLFPNFSFGIFVLINIFVLFLSLKNLEYGLLIAFAELIISSKGYLFSTTMFDFSISIRMSIWLIVVSIGILKLLFIFFKERQEGSILKKIYYFIIKNKEYYALSILLFLVFLGFIIGINKNQLKNVFLDFNAWLFFAYFIPVYSVYLKKNKLTRSALDKIIFVTATAVGWVSVKSLLLLYFFTHNFSLLSPTIYKWVRDTGVGEITRRDDGFYRIFLQSHIFVLIAFFLIFGYLISLFLKNFSRKKEILSYFFLSILFLSVNILSFSRTNWLGLIIGLIFFFLCIFYVFGIKFFLKSFSSFMLILFFSFILLFSIVKFPFPENGTLFSLGSVVDRASDISNEAGVSSRWSLLPKMFSKVLENPILGSGFGTEITYKSSDPRVLENSDNGDYTTFSFEWGWLDFWIKIGFFGFLSYFIFLFLLFLDFINNFLKKKDIMFLSLSVSVLSLSVIHFFSPYLNHPLGIGIILILLIFSKVLIKNQSHNGNLS